MTKKACLAIAILVMQNVPPPTLRSTGSVQGIVTRADTNDPIADVEIQIHVSGGPTMSLEQAQSLVNFVNEGNALPRDVVEQAMDFIARVAQGGPPPRLTLPLKAVTDSNGQFSISNVPVGETQILAQLSGFFGPASHGSSPTNLNARVVVSAQKTASVRFTMIPGSSISGRITDPNGKALADAMVRMMRQSYPYGHAELELTSVGKTTDDRGEYRLFRIPPGEYFISVLPRSGPRSAGSNVPTEVPVTTLYPGVTDVLRAAPIVLKGGEELTGVNMQTISVSSATITGKVTSTFPVVALPGARGGIQQPVASVSIVPHGGLSAMSSGSLAAITANPDGSFEIPGVAPGVYDLIARLPTTYGWANLNPPERALAAWAFGRTTVEVGGANADNVVIVVNSGVDVPGRVLVDGRPASPAISLRLTPDESMSRVPDDQTMNSFGQIDRYRVNIETDGSFKFPVLPEGRYKVRALLGGTPGTKTESAHTPLPNNAYVADVRQGSVSVYDNGLVVGTEAANPLEVIINTNGGVMNGQISGLDRIPVGMDITTVLVPSENRRQNSELYFVANTDADNHGRFAFSGVPPGSYKLFAWANVKPGQYQNAEFLRQNENRGVPVTILANAIVSVEVEFIP